METMIAIMGALLAIGAAVLVFFLATKASAAEDVMPKTDPGTPPSSRQDFVNTVFAAVQSVATDVSVAGQQLITAHAAYESGWGSTTGYRKGNNLFNITRSTRDPGPIVEGGDTEYDAAGNVKNITQRFRAYPSIEASITDYLQFIQQSRFGSSYDLLSNGDPTFVYPLRQGGYYTLPADQYYNTLVSVLARVKSMTQNVA